MSSSASSVPTNACRSAVDLDSAVSHGVPSCQTKSVLLTRLLTRRRPEETLRPVCGAFTPGSVLWRVERTAVWAQLVEPDPEMAMALPQPRSTLVRSGRSTRHDRTWASRDNWRISSRSVRQPTLRFDSCEPRIVAARRAFSLTFPVTQRDAVNRRAPGVDVGGSSVSDLPGSQSSLAEVLFDLTPRPPGGSIMPDLTRHMRQKRTLTPNALVYRYTVLGGCSPVVSGTGVRADGAKKS